MTQPEIKTRSQLVTEAIRRFVVYTDQVTWWGKNSVGRAIAEVIASATSTSYRLYRALLRRVLLVASSGDYTTALADEKGARRRGTRRAKVLVVVRPHATRVTAITSGGTDLLEVSDSTHFAAGNSIRVRNADGTSTETATIIAVTTGTGPNSGDELEVATLAGSYTPSTSSSDVVALRRYTIAAGTQITSTAGVTFETIEALTVGDANPLLDGESTYVGLADKVWAEATTRGGAGNIDPLTVSGFASTIDAVNQAFNPERGTGGEDEETDFDLKYRAAHGPTRASAETASWIEQLAREADDEVVRALITTTSAVGTMAIKVLAANGGPLSATRLTAIEAYIQQRVRGYMRVSTANITLTEVTVSATITLDPDATLRDVWKNASQALAQQLDWRYWTFDADVDEAALLTTVKRTSGVATLVTSSFVPAADVDVGAESLPVLVSLTLTNAANAQSVTGLLEVSY